MAPEDEDRLWGAITALNQLVEHLWAFTLDDDDASVRKRAVQAIRDKMLAEFDLPAKGPHGDGVYAAQQHAVSTLEEFWDRVEERVR